MKLINLLSQIQISPTDLDIPKPALDSANGSDNVIARVFEILFATLGAVAFLMIVLAGLKFSLSRGNPDAATKARNTVVYSLVGLVISLSAYAIVRFVVSRT